MTWVTSDGFVGRADEQRCLADLLCETAAGEGGAVLLAGEAGIGKSRLAEECARNAAEDGLTVGWGRCRESEGAPPLWPWLQILRRLRVGPPVPGESGEAASRFRLFEQVVASLSEAAAENPLLIVLDDAHRADEASLRLLAFAADQIWPAPVGVVVAYRDDELEVAVGRPVLAQLAANRRGRQCELTGLTAPDVDRWLALHMGDSRPRSGVAIHARTGGNPLFVDEVVRLLESGGDHGVPRSVQELITERFERLPEVPQDVIEVAAVLGRDFGYAPVASALKLSPLTVVEALQSALDARLVSLDDTHPGGYRFRHVLAREAVLDRMSESRRVHLHALAVAALRDTGAAQASDLAEHALRARPEIGERLVATLVADAAEDAARMLAWEDAVRWWRQMLDSTLARSIGVDPDQLRLRIGHALLSAGRGPEARECFEETAERADRDGDGALLAAAALAVGDTAAEVATDVGLVRLLDLALNAPDVPQAVRIRLLARRAMASYWSQNGRSDAARFSAAAVEAGLSLGDDEALGAALVARQFALRGPDGLADRIDAGEAVHAIAVRLGDEKLRFRAIQWLIPDRFQEGELGLVHELLGTAREIARTRRDPVQRWWVGIFDGLLAGFAGDDVRAERMAGEAAALGRRLGLPAADVYAAGQLVPVLWRAGRLAEIRTRLDDLAKVFPQLVTLQCDRALVLAETGQRSSARRLLSRLCADGFAALPRDSLFVASLAILAATAVTLDDVPQAAQLLSALGAYPERNLIQGVPTAWGSSEWHLARLAAVVGDRQAAQSHAATSRRLHEKWGAAQPGPTPLVHAPTVPVQRLSPREGTVLRLVAEGHSNKEIAQALGISVHTAERHVANIFGKLGVRNRTEATAWAHRQRAEPTAT